MLWRGPQPSLHRKAAVLMPMSVTPTSSFLGRTSPPGHLRVVVQGWGRASLAWSDLLRWRSGVTATLEGSPLARGGPGVPSTLHNLYESQAIYSMYNVNKFSNQT